MDILERAEKELEASYQKDKKKEKPNYTANFNGLVDLVEDQEKTKFLTFKGEILSEKEIDGKVYLPPPKVDWLLPNGKKVLELVKLHDLDTSDTMDSIPGCTYCQKTLLPKILAYFRDISQPPTGYHYLLLVLAAFHSFLIEYFNYSPILFLVATKGRGKTPTLKALAYISRRGILTETFREANLIRWASDYQASLFLDVRDFPKKVERAAAEDLIYGRAERGVTSSRVLFPEKGAYLDMVTFSSFGVTGATSNVMVDAITEARCIVFNMPFSKKVYDIEPSRELGLPIKEELTAFRMAHFKKAFLNVYKKRPGKLENYLRGYHQMVRTHFPTYEKSFLKLKEVIYENKHEEAENTLEAKLLLAVIKLIEKVEDGGFLATELVANTVNEGISEKFALSTDRVGRELKGMGFKSIKNSSGDKRGIFYNVDLIESIKEQYGLVEAPQEKVSDMSGVPEKSKGEL